MKHLILTAFLAVSSLAALAQGICTATTKKGSQCTRKATGSYCKQHDPDTPKCGEPTKAGKPCTVSVKTTGTKCHNHKNPQ